MIYRDDPNGSDSESSSDCHGDMEDDERNICLRQNHLHWNDSASEPPQDILS